MPVMALVGPSFRHGIGIRGRTFGLQQQEVRADFQACRDSFDIIDGNIAFPALDTAKIGPVHFDIEGKDLLTDAKGFSVSADVCCDDSP